MAKKLIEVALPLEAINKESAREKSIRYGHPSTLHLWWARRPLAAARAVIWSSLIDDPSEHPETFPTEEAQIRERERLFGILRDLVVWENSTNEDVLAKAKAEIQKSVGMETVSLLDPFAGGGSIPLEAQRLGLTSIACDLNPVAVMINKATIEIPALFSGFKPVNPVSRVSSLMDGSWGKAAGLIADISYYGKWVKEEVYKKVGHRYPTIKIPSKFGGGDGTVIAWLWTRTVTCPNPICRCEMPLLKNALISKKKGNEAWVEPIYDENKRLSFSIHYSGKPRLPYTVNRKGAVCACCGTPVDFSYIRTEGKEGRMSSKMMAIIVEGDRKRIFLPAEEEQVLQASCDRPENFPDAELPYDPQHIAPPNYGLMNYSDLFTNRQLNTMVEFSQMIKDAKKQIIADAVEAGLRNDHISLADGGKGATAYAEAICVYLGFAVDREANYCPSQNGWSGDFIIQVFGRQAIPMVWDYAETNPFSNSTGNWTGAVKWITDAMAKFPADGEGKVYQHDAQSDNGMRNMLISTDPPYYNNIIYSNLSDYFYLWLRYSIKDIYPEIFRTMLVPKEEELVAAPYRFDGDMEKAKEFFEAGMSEACKQLYNSASDYYPITIYYAYKQSDTEETDAGAKTASSGWETMLSAIIGSELEITGTWPMHTERETGLKASMNALATSIVLVCRKRSDQAKVCTRRAFVNELKRELRPALQKLQSSNIAPVDLAQSAIGPGIGVFSRYESVLEADGTPMSVRSALQIINQELDMYFNEQDSELDSESRFCVDLYSQFAFNEMPFGDANTLATAKNTSVAIMASHGILYAQKGKVHLIERTELPETIDEHEGGIWLLCQQLTHRMDKEGVEGCARAICNMFGSNAERAKDLAYRLYTIADRKKWTQEAYAYNALVVAWPEIQSRAAELKAIQPEQMTIFDYPISE